MNFFQKAKDALNNGAQNIASGIKGGNKSKTITFADIPDTLDKFTAVPEAAMSEPFDTAALTVVALCNYPMNSDLALQMLSYLRGPNEMSAYERQFLKERMSGREHVPRSYFEGATPANDYMPTEPFRIIVRETPYSYQDEGYATLYIASGGSDNPRPVKLRKAKDGKWYLWEQFLMVDIRAPESTNPWA